MGIEIEIDSIFRCGRIFKSDPRGEDDSAGQGDRQGDSGLRSRLEKRLQGTCFCLIYSKTRGIHATTDSYFWASILRLHQAKVFTYREYATSGAGLCFLALGGLIQVLSHGTFIMQQILLAMW